MSTFSFVTRSHGAHKVISIFFLFVYVMTIVMRSWFRALAAIFGSPAPAQTVAGLATLILVLYTGYSIPKPSMIGALKWLTYINVRPADSLRCLLLADACMLLPAAALWFRIFDGQ